jgi:hypothetical protein
MVMTDQRLPLGRKHPFPWGSDGWRIQIDVESCDLAVPDEDEVLAYVPWRLAFGARALSQAGGVVQDARCSRWRIDVVGMHLPEITRELVERIVSHNRAGRSVHDCILSIDLGDHSLPALRVILAEDLSDIALQQCRNELCVVSQRGVSQRGVSQRGVSQRGLRSPPTSSRSLTWP